MIKIKEMNNTKFISTLLIFISLFVIILFTKWQIFRVSELNNVISEAQAKKDDLVKEYNKLESIKNNKLKSKLSDIEKYTKKLKEDELLDFIYSEIFRLNLSSSSYVKKQPIIISGLKISDSQLNLLNFYESNIDLNLVVPNESRLREVLNILNNNDKYKFFITSLNYENNKENQESWDWITVSIPFKVFYSNYEWTK